MRRCAGEAGATLVLALIVVLIASLVGVGIANLTATSLSFSSSSSADRQMSYAADGAADWAIAQVLQAINGPTPAQGQAPVQGQDTTTTIAAPADATSSPCTLAPTEFPDFPGVTVTGADAPTGDGQTTGGAATCTFTVTGTTTAVTYLQATVSFSSASPAQATVQAWVERPVPPPGP